MAKSATVSLKLLIDEQGERVLFAEAGKEFVDFLFHILSLPMSTVINLVGKQGMVGSVSNIYESVQNLNQTYIQPDKTKDSLLKTVVNSSVPLLKAFNNASSSSSGGCQCSYRLSYVSDDPRASCPSCHVAMTTAVRYVAPPVKQESSSCDEEGLGFVKGVVTYMVMDDLVVTPMSTISSITLLNKFNIKEVGALQEKVVNMGMAEAVKLLKASLETDKVLTNVFLNLSSPNLENPTMAESTLSLKLLINSQSKRVLFAEAGKDFVDFLFYVLSLPVGTVINLLKKQENIGSLANLYESIENLNETYIQPNKTKEAILKPVATVSGSSVPLLALNDASSKRKFYRCSSCAGYVSDDANASCPSCSRKMTTALSYVAPPQRASGEVGFVKGVVTYMVMDDLAVIPLSTISSITLLHKFQVKELSSLEEKVVTFGMDEALKLLSAALYTNNVLTDVFLNCTNSTSKKPAVPKSMSLKLLIDTQGKRVLYAEANKGFVDFLFHILSLPVGTLVSFLKSQGNIGSLANLYNSIENLNDSYMQLKQTKDTLLKPMPLSFVGGPNVPGRNLYMSYCDHPYVSVDPKTACPKCKTETTRPVYFVGPTPCGEAGFVKDMVTYMVMDDLSVTPLSTMSSFALLLKLDVKDMSAVEEKVVNFGMDEAVKLLNASLHTHNVLTDVFLNCTTSTSKKRACKSEN
ncbi:hypothetical protein ABFX02_14G243100 [Erythranthe guttata]